MRLIEFLLNYGADVAAIVTREGRGTIGFEILNLSGYSESDYTKFDLRDIFKALRVEVDTARLREYDSHDWFSPGASGTGSFEAVIVAPCSMKTLSAVANGYSDSLVTRSVDVALKERRRAILVPRETPLSLIHLENMVKAKRAGVDILPPVLEFYTRPAGIDDLVNFTVGKILNLLDIKHGLIAPWGEGYAE